MTYIKPWTIFSKNQHLLSKVLLWFVLSAPGTIINGLLMNHFHWWNSVRIRPCHYQTILTIKLTGTFLYRLCAIVSRGLYICQHIFHWNLYCRALKILQTIYVLKRKNPRSIIESSFKSRAGYDGACRVFKSLVSLKMLKKIKLTGISSR